MVRSESRCRAHSSSRAAGGLRSWGSSLVRAIYKGPPGLPGWPVGSEMQMGVVAGGQTPFPVALTYFAMLAFAKRPNVTMHIYNPKYELLQTPTSS